MFKHILIPTDGSTLSNKALKHGLALAGKLKAKVTALYVFMPFPMAMVGELGMGWETAEQQMRQFAKREGKKHLNRADAIARAAGVKVDRLMAEGAPIWGSILDVARKKRCDAIFMGAHGHGAVASLLLGSQTNAVLAHSKIPVLVYR